MSTPSENIDTSAVEAVAPSLPTGADSWILELGINDVVEDSPSPLPADAGTDAPQSVATGAVIEATGSETTQTEAAPPAEAQELEAKDSATTEEPDAEITPEDDLLIKALPEQEQPAARNRFRKASFMDQYKNPDKPATEIRTHLEQQSSTRYAELETSIIENRLAQTDLFAADLYKRSPEAYSKLASEVYRGDPAYFAKQVTGREGVTPEYVQTALDFYERNKDKVQDDASDLSEIDEEMLAEMETYFPDKAQTIRTAVKMANELQQSKATQTADAKVAKPDQAKAVEPLQAPEIMQDIDRMWTVAQDVVGDSVTARLYDPQKGAGVHVTPEERKAAPQVAMLKDLKANVFLYGLNDAKGNTVIPGYYEGFTEWAKDRPGFKDTLLHVKRYADAREEKNVREMAMKAVPLSDTYYSERLKDPRFAAIDEIINSLVQKGATRPQFDVQVAGQLPNSGNGNATPEMGGDAWLIADAVNRAR